MNHFHISLRAVARLSVAAVVSLSTGVATTAYAVESAARETEVAAPIETLVTAPEPIQHGVADLSSRAAHPEASASPPVEYRQLPSPHAECVRTESRSSLAADQRLQQIADVLELGGEQTAELQAIRMLADDRFTPHISQRDLAESVRAVLSGAQADCLIALLLRGSTSIKRLPAN